MSFLNFVNEARIVRINASQFKSIALNAFGLLAKVDVSGKGGNQLIADLSALKSSQLKNKELFDLIVHGAALSGVTLVPTDEASKDDAHVAAGGGGDDVLAFKVKGNDYSSNKDHDDTGEFNADLFFNLDQFILTS